VDRYNRINTYHNDETLASSIKQNTQQMEKGKTKREDPIRKDNLSCSNDHTIIY
jgi:hypothetical protein